MNLIVKYLLNMPNPIKFSSTSTLGSYQKGNISIGTNPISYAGQAGWYNGINIPEGKTLIVEVVDDSTPPRFYVPNTDDEWIRLATQEGASGNSVSSVANIKSWFSTQSNYVVTNIDFSNQIPNMVGNGLLMNLDGRVTQSYSGSGGLWKDISGNGYDGVLTNGPVYNPAGYFDFDGTDDYINLGTSGSTLIQGKSGITIGITFKLETNAVLRGLIGTLAYGCGGNLGLVSSNGSLSFYNDYGPWPATGGTCYSIGFNNYVTSNNWIYAVATYDGSVTTVYGIKGGNLSTSTGSAKTGLTNIFNYPFTIMRGGVYYSDGKVGNAFVYDRVLTQTEVLQNYYQSPIVTDGLVFASDASNLLSYESGSTVTYSLTGSFSGNLLNGVSYMTNNDGTFSFDGTDDYIQIPYNSYWDSNVFGSATTFSISCWAKCNRFYDWTCLIQKSPNSGFYSQSEGASLWIQNNGFVAAFGNGESGNPTGYGTTMLYPTTDTNKWFNLTFVGNGTTLSYYVNGSLYGSALVSNRTRPVISSLNGPALGRRGGGSLYNGQMSGALFYTKALSASEVLQNFNAQRARFGI